MGSEMCIRDRLADSEDRAVTGLGEGDLIAGANNSVVGTFAERYSPICDAREYLQ